MLPVGIQAAEGDPKHPVKVRQKRTLLLSLKCRYLDSQSRVLNGYGVMAAEEQSEESKHQQKEAWHVSDSSSHLHHSQPITERSEYWRSTIGNFEEKTSLSNGKPEWRCHSGHKDPIVSDLPHHRHQILIQLGG